MNYLGRVIYPQGNILGYRDSFFIVGAIFLAALVPALMMRRGRARPAPQARDAMPHPPSSQNALQQGG